VVMLAGRSATALAKGAQVVAKKGTMTLLKDAGTDVVERRLGKAVMGQVSERVSERTLVRLGVTDRLSHMQPLFRTAVRQSPIVEITQPARFMLGYSGVGQKTLQHLIRLEAQVWRLNEAKVVIFFRTNATGKPISQFMNTTAQNGVLASDPAQAIIKKGVQSAIEREESWRKHMSAWWLMHTSGLLDTTIAEVAK
jgi:hypothetical protein